jgi:glycosyltransferase involved in cell wall biosynthesis
LSVIIPTFNGALRIRHCLDALVTQTRGREVEILVVDDGSSDNIAEVVACYPGVRLIRQANAGPAAARNRGVAEARGTILLFTDDDCVPAANWLEAMLEPFREPEVIGAKGVYCTHQDSVVARFVQFEYEDRYRLMVDRDCIDFIDTYSAAFRRARFLEMKGYDTSFPVACAEDIELSYRMSRRRWKMKFVPSAVVAHTHPHRLSAYLRKKYKFAFWRVLALSKNPGKSLKDSHTPQLMKLQLLFAPALLLALVVDQIAPAMSLSLLVLAAFLASTIPFAIRAARRDPIVGLLSPALLAARSVAQMLGISAGLVNVLRKSKWERAGRMAERRSLQ